MENNNISMKTKKLKSIIKYCFLAAILFVFVAFGAFAIVYFTGDKVRFDENKFYQSVSKINFYDKDNLLIDENNTYNVEFIKLSSLDPLTPQAFISIEDKQFYNHKGLNYKRIAKAFLLNLKNRNMAQGASTITQQLIKNTHLSSQKTISRKVNEIVLAKELENKLSKEQILENYLNIIYFGDNCYGIEKAANHYFSKSAKDLSLHESALLAAVISSPAYYSPVTKPDSALKRRNLVLSEMLKDGAITQEQYQQAINQPLGLNLKEEQNNNLNTYTECALDEAMQALKLSAKQISLGGYKIYTYYDKQKQQSLLESVQNTDFQNSNYAAVSMNALGQIEAFAGYGNYKTLQIKRQPASAIKPILVYAPAINQNIISPITQILDEEISISGYKPQNHDLQFHGYLSVQEAISKSYNVPAVKIMSYLGLEKGKQYATQLGIEFDSQDNNYAIALGGMTYGTTLKQLTGAYTAFANNGQFCQPRLISYITDKNDNIVYISNQNAKQVFRPDTVFLTNQMLIEACKSGTSKGLAGLPFEVASKTGTVGKYGTNYDAWAISYTTQDIVGVWIGNLNNKPIGNIVGGTVPIKLTKQYMEKIYSTTQPQNFAIPEVVVQAEIDLKALKDNHQVMLASNFLPDEYRQTHWFFVHNMPLPAEDNIILMKTNLDGKIENGKAVLSFDATQYAEYQLFQNGLLIQTFNSKQGKVVFEVPILDTAKHTFTLKTKLKNYKTKQEFVEESAPVELIKTKNTSENLQKIKSKWYL
jgi:membrane peptidoglycan carboxypeptidase